MGRPLFCSHNKRRRRGKDVWLGTVEDNSNNKCVESANDREHEPDSLKRVTVVKNKVESANDGQFENKSRKTTVWMALQVVQSREMNIEM